MSCPLGGARPPALHTILDASRDACASPPTVGPLDLLRRFVKFKQGEMWARIREELELSGVRPTAPDRERLDSGVELTEHLARTLRDTQGALLNRQLQAAQEQEAAYYENMRAQRKLEHEARFYKVRGSSRWDCWPGLT